MANSFTMLMIAVDSVGVAALASLALSDRIEGFSVVFRLGLVLLMIGLLGQLGRDVQCITEVCAADGKWSSAWVLKDIGATLVALVLLAEIKTYRDAA